MDNLDYEAILKAYPDVDASLPETGRDVLREDMAYILGSLSRLFFSTYYINLEQDTYRAVTQLRRVGDVLGDEVRYTPALQLYANYFVYPDDREEYLRVMDVDNLRQQLRWWQPNVAVEYRKLTDGPDGWSWVRATAVLARTSGDDLPSTAVYVSQDINGRRHLPVPKL